MQRAQQCLSRAYQWGRAGPIMALVSILIVAALAKVTLAQFGLTQQDAAAPKAASKGAAAVVAETEGDDDAVAAPSAPTAAVKSGSSLDKARAVQGLVNNQATKTESQIESEGK